ncbi:MAG: hypothetical protein V8T31_10135 [Lachnospiraceae bacterium]
MQQFDELKKERMQLAAERISEIVTEAAIPAPFARYFKEEAEFISQMLDLAETDSDRKNSRLDITGMGTVQSENVCRYPAGAV